jgi:hypothetical protein
MTDWRKLALTLTLSDGVIDDSEVKVLKQELFNGGKIDKQDVNFLIELRGTAQKRAKSKGVTVNPAFEKLFFQAVEANAITKGKIDTPEARWLRSVLFADKRIDANKKRFLNKLKKTAKKTSPAFDKLYAECMSK